ncbi:MAG: Npt1/Npt2 family nucleotide transporter, partial [Saprospiraceae bacterium]|nr:Npt1/Npt2 family nucleotide transporter [Saprospiraceae bacterium]
MRQGIESFLHRAFDIREGEVSRALLMQVMIFLIICTLLIVKPTVNSLFLSKFGVEKLPNAFVLIALSAALVSSLYSRWLERASLGRIISGTFISSVVVLLLFGILLRQNFLEGWVLYLFYIWVAIFALLSTSQFWILANLVFNPREAKRLFGFIGAGAIAGGVFGGYMTSLLAPLISSENLLFISAGLLAICLPVSRRIWKENVAEGQSRYQQKKRTRVFAEHPFQLIRESKHLTFLASIIGVSVVVAKLVDYQFSAVASAKIHDPDELTAFFGFWFSTLNIISLLVQLFLTRRVVGVFGVGTSLFFLPLGIMVGALVLFFIPELWAAIFLKINDGSLKQSINKAAVELLALPIPREIKNQTKSFIDIFVDSAATGAGGLILIFLVRGLDLSTRFISLMIILLIGLWIYFALRVRGEYLKSFKLKVRQVAGRSAKKTIDISNESVLGGLVKVLKGGSEKQILFVLDKLREVEDDRLFEPLKALLTHESGEVRAEAIRNLYFFRNRSIPAQIEPFTRDPDQRVKIQAFEYLVEHKPGEAVGLMERYLRDEDYAVCGAALVSLAIETKDNSEMKRVFHLKDHIEEKYTALPYIGDDAQRKIVKLSVIRAIGHYNDASYYPILNEFMEDEDGEIAGQALISAAHTLSEYFVDPLISRLGNRALRNKAAEALANYGQAIISKLAETMEDLEVPVDIRRAVPLVVEKINSQKSVDFLFALSDYEDTVVRMEALRALNSLKTRYPHLRFDRGGIIRKILVEAKLYLDTLSVLYAQMNSMGRKKEAHLSIREKKIREARQNLIVLLERRLDGNLERIFRLLGLKYPPEDVMNIYRSIKSSRPEIRSNAIEFLDNLLASNLRRILMPIVEVATQDSLTDEAIKNLKLKIPDEYDCLQTLLEGKDMRIKMAVFYLLGQMKEEK